MSKDKDERKRPQLRLVVNNVEKRSGRPVAGEDDFITLDELILRRHEFRGHFYAGVGRLQEKAYRSLERYLERKGWAYGLDPLHGRLMVIPAGLVCPEAIVPDSSQQDEVLVFAGEDLTGVGLCLSLEMIIPFWSDDDAVMEDALLSAPILPYGMLFLEENRQDGYLDLIYRVALPLYPPAPTVRVLDKLFAVARTELAETLRTLADFSD
ncbi:hypothetical protein [Geobacter sulfurreducens]|uniref:hypothetical protein n=1 Tax=Geobacter sulfurreducens TaxID=35554 RepID=UPI000DBB2D0E|nr:hypothetical protein [Geobacter sulfurreducens]BBA69478.1 hypothetical protein YM18_0931 [Geobacter sulfurreducens]